MYILEEYTFSPGEAGSGTITISGSFTQESFGVITNVTRGSVLYDPSEGRAGATITLAGGSTILTLEQNTTYCDELDKLQITVYGTEAGGGGGGGGGGGSDAILTEISEDTDSINSKLPELTEGRIPVDAGEVEIKNDSGNPVTILPAGVIDSGNGFSGTLTENQVFTGTGVEVAPKYGTISVCIFSSHSSASLGLKFQASIDNVNWETIEQYNYLAGSGLESYSFSPSGRYFRIQYTNGTTATTKTAIFTVLRSGYAKSSSHRIGDVISPEKDAELVKAVLAAQKPNGIFTDINATAGGNLKVSIEETEGPLPVTGPLTDTELRASPVSVISAVSIRTPTTTSVVSSASSVTILASNANRRGISIANDSTSVLRLSFATPATIANAFIVMQPGSFLLLDQQLIVTNAIYGLWASANGTAQVTEYV